MRSPVANRRRCCLPGAILAIVACAHHKTIGSFRSWGGDFECHTHDVFRCFLLFCATLPATTAVAGIVYTELERSGGYQQVGPTETVAAGHRFVATAGSDIPNQYDSVTLAFAGPRSPVTLLIPPEEPLFFDYIYAHPDDPAEAMITQEDLYAEYPLGNYTFTGIGDDGSPSTGSNPFVFSDTISENWWPLEPLHVSAASFSALQAVDPSAELTLDIVAQLNVVSSLPGFLGGIFDLNNSSQVLSLSSALPPSEWTIPAGTLLPNRNYLLFLSFSAGESEGTETQVVNGISSTTSMLIHTVPEPGTYMLLATGLVGWLLAGAVRRCIKPR